MGLICWIICVVLPQLCAADIPVPGQPYRQQPYRQQPYRQQPYRQDSWTFTPREALGATDLVCLAGTVTLAAMAHRQLRRWPETCEAATVPDVVRDAWSQPNASERPRAAFPSDDAIGEFARVWPDAVNLPVNHLVSRVASDEQYVQQQCRLAGFSAEQADVLIARLRKLHAAREVEPDLVGFVGDWTDGVREFGVRPDGQVVWKKAARPVSSFRVREPARINLRDGSLEFTLEFPPDGSNPTGKATWHLGSNTVWQTFEQSMPPHHSLTQDGRSTLPVQWSWSKDKTDDSC